VNLRYLRDQRSATVGARRVVRDVSFAGGSALLLWSSYIHFHLWDAEGYRHIPTIGDLFLLQVIAGVLVAITAVVVRRRWAGLLGAGFALSTLIGFLISVDVGLFGFKDSSSAPFAHEAFGVEVGAIVLFVLAVWSCASTS
jgi:hypothetical protein